MIAEYMKLACSTVFVSCNYSTNFRSDDFSSIKEFDQVGETAKKWLTNFKLKELSHGILSYFEHRQNYC